MKNLVIYEIRRGIATVSFNRPDRHNAFSPALLEEFVSVMDRLARDEQVRILVLAGRGKSFSSGVDLKSLSDLNSVESAKRFALLLEKASETLFKFPKPVIARLHGSVLGGAAGFAAACDLRVASEGTRIGFPAVKLGAILPATCTVYVESLIGRSALMELTLTGRTIGAREALQMKFVNDVVAENRLDEKIEEIIRLISEGTPEALSLTKQTVNFPFALQLEQAKLYAADNFAYLSQTESWKKRMKNFFRRK